MLMTHFERELAECIETVQYIRFMKSYFKRSEIQLLRLYYRIYCSEGYLYDGQ